MKRKLFLLLCTLLTMIGVQNVKAYQAPAADGVYYIQNVKTGKFINYGWNFGARIGVDDYGTAWKLIADGDNFKIQAYVTNDRNFQDDTWMYSDGGGDRIRSYIISGVAGEDGVYTLENTSNNRNVYVYLKEDGDKYFVAGNAIKGDNYNDDDQTYWRFLSQAERDAYIAAQVHEREAAILADYGFTLPANKTLSEYLEESPYFKQAVVEVAAMSGWTWTSMPNTNSTIAVSTFDTSALEVYQGEGTDNNKLKLGGTLSKTLEGLSAGLYKVTVPAMYRFGGNADCYANEKTNGYKGLNGGGYVSAGGNAVPLATWASSCKNDGNPNSPSEFGTIVGEGGYQNVTFANVTGTTLDLAISIPGSIVKGWFCTKQATAIRYNLKTLSDAAIAYPANGELAAGQWYYYDFATADDYYFDASSKRSSISYSTDGSQLITVAAGDPLPTKISSITAGSRYYFKSTENQTLTIAASDVTNTYLSNPSFELSAGNTPLSDNIKVSNAETLSVYGWTETLGDNNYNNREVIDGETTGSNSNHSAAIAAADGTYHFFMRRSWNNNSSKDYTYQSTAATYAKGHYDVTFSYILEEGTSKGNTSTGSYLTLKALNGSDEINSKRVDAHNYGYENYVYTDTWKTSTLSFDLDEDKEVSLAVVITPRGGNKTEVHLDNFTITYSPFADAADYAALNAAISFVEGQTWGFGVGEYAPYNNKGVLKDLADAKALNQEGNNSRALVLNLAATLTGATYTANAEEVNAIWDGSFAYSYSHDGNVQPFGWTGGSGHDNATDVRYQWNVESNPGLAATTNSTALFTKYDAYYGKATGYTMPLKAHTMYKLTFKYGTWGKGDDQTRGDGYIQMKDGSSNTITVNPSNSLTLTADERGANANMEKWKNFTGYFTTTEAGNYVLDLLKTTTSQQNQYVYGDFSLVRATASEIKPYLFEEIETATNDIYNSGDNVGTGVFQITEAAGTAFLAAIAAAQSVYDNVSATADDVMDAIDDLKAAEETFLSTVNAPVDGQFYSLNLAGRGALSITTNGSTEGGYDMTFTTKDVTSITQAFLFEATGTKNTYLLYFYDLAGNKRYACTRAQYGSGGTGTYGIRTFVAGTEGKEALRILVQATSTENVFNMFNTECDNKKLGSNGGGFYTDDTYTSWSIEEASPVVSATLGTNGYTTFASPYALDLTKANLPLGLKAYKAQSVSTTSVHFEEFDQTVPANTGILFEGTAGATYNIPVVASGDAVSGNLFRVNEGNGYINPNYVESTTEVYYFAMIKDSDPLAFGKFNPASYKYPSNKAYLTVAKNTGARLAVSFGEEDGFTGINAVEAAEAEDGALKDGKYIIDNKVVIVKNGVKYSANGQKLN